MGKLLTWIVIGAALWFGWRMLMISKRRSERAARPSGEPSSGGQPAGDRDEAADPARMGGPERMVQCAACGLHLPASEGHFAGGKAYCSPAHRDQAAGADQGTTRSQGDRSGRD
jgi:uncharacterized protein